MGIRKWALAIALGAIGLSAIGAGVAATFTDQATASQTITVGALDIQLSSTTPGATVSPDGDTLTCPPLAINTASGLDPIGCTITVTSVGTITPAQVNVTMTAATDGAALSRFGITPTGFPTGVGHTEPGFFTLSTSPQQIGHFFMTELPGTFSVPVSWGEYAGPAALDNGDMGKTVVVTYTVDAWQ
jgi:predicted ribosomally synthesized peptide with SipW-like signal peptide